MKSSFKLLNRLVLLVLIFFVSISHYANAETKDIWQQSKEIKTSAIKEEAKPEQLPSTIFNVEKKDTVNLSITNIAETNIEEKNREIIFGIYDPEATGIPIDFWKNIDPIIFKDFEKAMLENQDNKAFQILIKKIFFSKINLNSFQDNGKAYLNFISSLLAENKNIELIDEVIDQNSLLLNNQKLLRFLIDHHFSLYQISKACGYAEQMGPDIQDNELQKFKVYCLVKSKQNKKASANLELMKEVGFQDEFFIKKINYLMGNFLARSGEANTDSLLNIHLSHEADKEFKPSYAVFQKDIIRKKYFFKSPLFKTMNIDFTKEYQTDEDLALINFLEDAANLNLYDYNLIFRLYKKIIFGIDDLLNPIENYAKYNSTKGKALLYQSILLSQDNEKKLIFIRELNRLYQKDNMSALGSKMFFQLTNKMSKKLITKEVLNEVEIKNAGKLSAMNTGTINNKILHQSDLINLVAASTKQNKKLSNILNDFDKQIKKNKYTVSEKDVAFINLLENNKVSIPDTLKKHVIKDEIYIPNKIYNLLEKKENAQAILENLSLVKNLNINQDYNRNFHIIVKIFDRLGLENIKKDFIKNELLAS
jgi:hypothetical protein